MRTDAAGSASLAREESFHCSARWRLLRWGIYRLLIDTRSLFLKTLPAKAAPAIGLAVTQTGGGCGRKGFRSVVMGILAHALDFRERERPVLGCLKR